MAVIPNNNSIEWTKWNNIGMALWRATDGSGEGLDLFDSWSQTWPGGYDAAYTAARWDGYEKCPPTEIGAGASSTWPTRLGRPGVGNTKSG